MEALCAQWRTFKKAHGGLWAGKVSLLYWNILSILSLLPLLLRLYNKESLLLALLDKKTLPEVANHIRSLKDVVELQFTPNPAYKPVARGMSGVKQAAEYVCPVSGLEMTGLHRWEVLIWYLEKF